MQHEVKYKLYFMLLRQYLGSFSVRPDGPYLNRVGDGCPALELTRVQWDHLMVVLPPLDVNTMLIKV